MYKLFLFLALFFISSKALDLERLKEPENHKILRIKQSPDFEITGDGTAGNWAIANWENLTPRDSVAKQFSTKFKMLYSKTGIYFLFNCEDSHLTATMNADFMDLWKEDVVEVFLWTDESDPLYFEYEISPLNFELPIIISNESGDLVRWQPFHYDSDRITKHFTSVQGGEKNSNAKITSWMAEFYIPYKLLRPLKNVPPSPGSKWRANFYRIDYDQGKHSWAWKPVKKSFHEYDRFGVILFE